MDEIIRRYRQFRKKLFQKPLPQPRYVGQLIRIHHFNHPWGIRAGWYIPYQDGQNHKQYVDFAFQKLLELGTSLEEADHPDNYRGDRGEPNENHLW